MSIFGGSTPGGLGGLGGLGGGGSEAPTAASMLEQAAKAELSKNLGKNLGPFIMGWTIDFILFGVMIHQTILWSHNYKTERLFAKIIVIWAVIVSTATTAYGLYYLWTSFVIKFGVFAQFTEVKKLAAYGVLDVVTIVPVQLFYLERAWRLMKQKIWVPILVVPFMIVSVVGGIGITVRAQTLKTILDGGKLGKWFYIFLGPTTAADILLTGLIMFGLSRSKTGWTKTDRLVNRLIRTSFETQLPGTIFAISFLVYYGLNNTALMNAFFQLVFTKIYVVSLLAVLNYRYTIRKTLDSSGGDSSQRKSNTFNLSNRHHQETLNIENIKVDTVVYEESHKSPELRIGVDRTRLPDEESGHSTAFTRETRDETEGVMGYDSRTHLREQQQEPQQGENEKVGV